MPLPLVAIVGRPNVGKSTLFNVLLGERVSIVDATAGTTRDRIAAVFKHEGHAVELVDTGGLGLVDESRLEEHINAQIDLAIAEADVVVFVVDVRDGIASLDRRVAGRLRKLDKPIILAANKADALALEHDAAEFYKLGLGEPIALSARDRINTREIRDRIFAALPEAPEAPDDGVPRIAIVGRRNAGKSTLLNALAGTGRVITSDIPGTTRDAVDVRIAHEGREYVFIDTAGVVKKTKVNETIEFYAQVRTVEAIERCDAALFVLDITEEVEQTDKKTSSLIADAKKPAVIVGNKWDLSRSDPETFADYFRKLLPGLGYAPVSLVSALKGTNAWQTVRLAEELIQQAAGRVTTSQVNAVFQRALEERTPKVVRTKVPKVFYATQVGSNPPTFVAFVNDPNLFPANYRRFLENRLRQELPFPEVPLRIAFRERTRRAPQGTYRTTKGKAED